MGGVAMVLVWFLVALVALLGELFTMSFYAVYEAVAAALVGVLALIFPSFFVQVIAFAVFSAVLLGLVRPLTISLLFRVRPQATVQFPDIAGKQATVRERVTDRSGLVEVGNGEFWSARSSPTGEVFEPGTQVVVAYREGIRLFVEAPKQPGSVS
jgi:inner membrane protein